MSQKFKPGDRVRVRGDHPWNTGPEDDEFVIGDEYTVVRFADDYVDLDRGPGGDRSPNGWDPDRFELVATDRLHVEDGRRFREISRFIDPEHGRLITISEPVEPSLDDLTEASVQAITAAIPKLWAEDVRDVITAHNDRLKAAGRLKEQP